MAIIFYEEICHGGSAPLNRLTGQLKEDTMNYKRVEKRETIETIYKLTPAGAVRAYCTQCLGLPLWNREKIGDCQGDQATNGGCPLYPFRLGKRLSVQVFRKYCLYCTCGDREHVAECPSTTCPMYPYRLGTNPALTGKRKSSPAGMAALQNFNGRRRDDDKRQSDFNFL